FCANESHGFSLGLKRISSRKLKNTAGFVDHTGFSICGANQMGSRVGVLGIGVQTDPAGAYNTVWSANIIGRNIWIAGFFPTVHRACKTHVEVVVKSFSQQDLKGLGKIVLVPVVLGW